MASEDVEKVSLAMNNVSLQVVEEEDVKKKGKVDRHCAFCLTLVPGAEVKLCGKCKRRAYCSKECQTADWKSPKENPEFNGKIHGYGQGHKNWCGLPYGEEDLDWKVAPITGKGLGLVALRDLPPLYKIIVDGMQAEPVLRNDGSYTPHHPGMEDLAYLAEAYPSLLEKFQRNAVNAGLGKKVGLRFSRANHSCGPNACESSEEQFRVLILVSNREIKEGEEICYPYATVTEFPVPNDKYEGLSPEYFRNFLFENWGFDCPPSCACRDLEKLEMLKTCKKLFFGCETDWERKNVLPKMEKVIEIAGKVGCSASSMFILYGRASEYARKSLEREKAREYFENSVKFSKAIFHPDSKIVQDLENGLKNM